MILPYRPCRTYSSKKDDPQKVPDISNPILEKYLKAEKARQKQEVRGEKRRPEISKGALGPKNIFSEVLPVAEPEKVETLSELQRMEEGQYGDDGALKMIEERRALLAQERPEVEFTARERRLLSMKLDPRPHARQRWERKAVIRSLRRRGRLTKPQVLMRTERQSTYQSPFLATSVKKLTLLMRQIAGKTVDDALVQLRMSKKKVAVDVIKGLQMARDAAIAGRGMGSGGTVAGAKGKGVEIELRDGKRKIVTDPTQIYIDQAWVGKGAYQISPEYRARGRINMLTHRTTCMC